MKLTIQTNEDRDRFLRLVKAVKLKQGKCYVAEFKQLREKRSLAQNRLIWVWMAHMEADAEFGSYSSEWWYRYFEVKFVDSKKMNGIVVPGVAKLLSTDKFSEFMQQIHIEALEEFFVDLKWPEEQGFTEYYEKYFGARRSH